MNRRLELLQLRKEALVLRAELERIDLAQHVTQLRRPSELSYKGLQWLSLLRLPKPWTPLPSLEASRARRLLSISSNESIHCN